MVSILPFILWNFQKITPLFRHYDNIWEFSWSPTSTIDGRSRFHPDREYGQNNARVIDLDSAVVYRDGRSIKNQLGTVGPGGLPWTLPVNSSRSIRMESSKVIFRRSTER